MLYLVAFAAALAALAAAVWPYIPKPGASGISASDRAGWVNRLFALAAAADEAGEVQIASSARSLITALVTRHEVAKRVR